MNSQKTKKKLTGSVIALIVCFAMLLGTTFAWFTDTASTSVNKIQSGTLDVALEVKDEDGKWVSAENQTLDFITAGDSKDILWEPGCTYYTDDMRIVNKGNLALKFKVEITGLGGDAKLNDVINWGLLNARDNEASDSQYTWSWKNTSGEEKYSPLNDEFYLLPGECVYMQLIAEMDENAGNAYQGLSIDNIAITVHATQYTYESDSVNNQYDENASYAYTVSSLEDLKAAIKANAPKIVLQKDIDFTCDSDDDIPFFSKGQSNRGCLMDITSDTVLDTNGYSINVYNTNSNFLAAFIVEKDAKLTIIGDGTIKVRANNDDNGVYAVWARGGSVDINGGNFVNENPLSSDGSTCTTLIYNSEETGQIHIYGGTYTYPACSWCQSCTNAYNSLSKKVIIVHEGAMFSQSFFMEWSDYPRVGLADGCKLEKDGSWYKVVKDNN